MIWAAFTLMHVVMGGVPVAQAEPCPSMAMVVERLYEGSDRRPASAEFELAVSRAPREVAEGLRELRGRYVRVVYRVGPNQGTVRDGYLGGSAPGGTLFLSSWPQGEGYGLPTDAIPIAPESIQSIVATGRPDSWEGGRAAMLPPVPRPEWAVQTTSRGAPAVGSPPAAWLDFYTRPSQQEVAGPEFLARMERWIRRGEPPLVSSRGPERGHPAPVRTAGELGGHLALTVPGYSSGAAFEVGMGRAMLDAEAGLRAGRIQTLEDLLIRLAGARREIARTAGEPDAENWGVARQPDDPVATTPFSRHGLRLGLEARVVAAGRTDATYAPEERYRGRHAPRTIRYTAVSGPRRAWIHMDPRHAADAVADARARFSVLMNRGGTRAEWIAAAAELHWYLAQAHPYRHGNAEIIDAAVRTLLRLQGIELGAWRRGFSPEIHAFHVSRERFVSEYTAYLNSPRGLD